MAFLLCFLSHSTHFPPYLVYEHPQKNIQKVKLLFLPVSANPQHTDKDNDFPSPSGFHAGGLAVGCNASDKNTMVSLAGMLFVNCVKLFAGALLSRQCLAAVRGCYLEQAVDFHPVFTYI